MATSVQCRTGVSAETSCGAACSSRARATVKTHVGHIFTKLGVPSFIVTLAGLLVWQGAQLQVLGSQGTINLPPSGGLQQFGRFSYLADWQSYGLAVVLPVLFLVAKVLTRARRTGAGLPVGALWVPVAQALLLLVVVVVVVTGVERLTNSLRRRV